MPGFVLQSVFVSSETRIGENTGAHFRKLGEKRDSEP